MAPGKSIPKPAPTASKPAPAAPTTFVKSAPATAPNPAATSAVAPKPRPTREQIALAAYYRWKRHGGDPTSNWLAAERELTQGGGTR